MNNNNRGSNNSTSNNSNRRRGRGSNRPQGGGAGGGGQQLNRVDSRARGNAPQLLEKYRKLAQDAHLNGDRVTAEYYLQFADHYFRVIADQRVRQDEQRGPRTERWQEGDAEGDEFSVESDFPNFDQQPAAVRREREDRPVDRGNDRPRRERDERPEREDRPEREAAASRRDEPAEAGDDSSSEDTGPTYEPTENPFVQENRGTRGLRPRREDRRPRRDLDEDAPIGLDPAMLPPAISISRDEPEAEAAAETETAEVKPRRRAPRRKPTGDDTGEPVESAR